ncbi:MAG: NAD-dependent epimerase/dehydratase family protein [Actinobacteria bacterium]|nr:NAD-dependent epimerase/dehydratase family protein [Actinomycetota bacterium]
MISKKNILITGAAGFIGANLVRKLIGGNNIHIFVKKSTNLWRLKDILHEVKIHHISLDNLKQIKQAVKRIQPQIIYHLAAHGSYPQQKDSIAMIKTNIFGTANLISALDQISYICFINTGSSSEYGFKSKPMKEIDILTPESFYAATKATTTYLCQVFAKSRHKPIITARPFSVYGPYEEPTRLIPTVVKNFILSKPVLLTPKKVRRDFIYIDDFIDFYLQVPRKINRNIYGEVFNVGTGKQHSNEEIVNIVSKILKKKVIIRKNAYKNRSWDSDYWVANVEKAKKTICWKPNNTLLQGLTKTVNWFLEYENFREIYC